MEKIQELSFHNFPASLWVETNGGVFIKAINKPSPKIAIWQKSEADDLNLEDVYYCDYNSLVILIPGSVEYRGAPTVTRVNHPVSAILKRAVNVEQSEQLDAILEKYSAELAQSTNPVSLQAELGYWKGVD